MPRFSVLAIRAALVYLAVGFSFGALLLANKGVPFAGWIWSLLGAHVEFLVAGWTVQLILGVAFWILPRYPGGSRGNETLAWLSLLLLNTGILLAALAVIGEVWFLPVGRFFQLAGAVFFAAHAWGRVRPYGKA